MKKTKILLALVIPALLISCSKDPELPYDLDGTLHTFAVSVTKSTKYDLLLDAGSTGGDYYVKLEVPQNMGDYSSYFKEAQLLCVYTPDSGAIKSAIAVEGITTLPAEVKIDMPALCNKLGITAPEIGDKMQFTVNIIHKDGTLVPGWTPTMGFNYRGPSFFKIADGSKFNYSATFSAAAPINEAHFAGGNTIKCTESVGAGLYEASYGADVTRMASSEIPAEIYGTDFTADDIIGLIISFDWYGWGYQEKMKMYINKKDYSVIIPDQVVGQTDENFSYYSIYPYIGDFYFSNANAELNTQTSIVSVTMNAAWRIAIGSLSFGSDNYEFDFGTVL